VSAVDWAFAENVAARCTRREPFVDRGTRDALQDSYRALTAKA